MSLSSDLVAQFVKATKDEKKTTTESTVYGTTVEYNGAIYVKLDGSDLLTPVNKTADVQTDERVTVMIKDHTATITGNVSSPAARTDDVQVIGSKITEFEIVVADKVDVDELNAEIARINALVSDNVVIRQKLDAAEANISELESENVKINQKLTANEADISKLETDKLSADVADITFATIDSLNALEITVNTIESTYGEFRVLTTSKFEALDASIADLETKKLSAKDADIKYANIDFSNIGAAAVEKLFADSGIIESLVMSDGKVTGELIGVTISGDLIKGNTIQADKLIVKGEDGLYHKLNIEGGVTTTETLTDEDLQNGLHGSVIIAKSVTAEKVAVDDLVAFDATIGGFQITEDAIYSGVKDFVENGTAGVYMDRTGQFAVGDSNNYIKFHDDADGVRRLSIAAESITAQIESATEAFRIAVDNLNKHFSFDANGLTIGAGENSMSLRIDNDLIIFEKNGVQFGWWDGVNFHTGNIMIEVNDRAQFGNFAFVPRSDGSLSFLKVEHKTGFYTINNNGTMVVYGAYPTLDDTTLVISDDMTGELDGTTLILNGG